MKKVSEIHGRFNSFAAVAAALGMKQPKGKTEKSRKCPECGGELRHIGASNVRVCDFSTLEESEYKKKGKAIPVYVIRKCAYREVDPV